MEESPRRVYIYICGVNKWHASVRREDAPFLRSTWSWTRSSISTAFLALADAAMDAAAAAAAAAAAVAPVPEEGEGAEEGGDSTRGDRGASLPANPFTATRAGHARDMSPSTVVSLHRPNARASSPNE